ncbi:hypothetical protein CDD83_8933 [Cordyceps sp. RAO-2017]|nr:hypothetical protein CDD83_8933 [Cordyceps sp. RAO-2017]
MKTEAAELPQPSSAASQLDEIIFPDGDAGVRRGVGRNGGVGAVGDTVGDSGRAPSLGVLPAHAQATWPSLGRFSTGRPGALRPPPGARPATVSRPSSPLPHHPSLVRPICRLLLLRLLVAAVVAVVAVALYFARRLRRYIA